MKQTKSLKKRWYKPPFIVLWVVLASILLLIINYLAGNGWGYNFFPLW